MQRKVKFRIWHPEAKTWLKKGLFESDDFKMKGNFHSQILIESAIPTIVQQFTGLTDKNGKEIYEGDMLVIPNGRPPEYGNDIVIVEYLHAGWIYRSVFNNQIDSIWGLIGNYGDKDIEGEIIGNIFENPELLKQ